MKQLACGKRQYLGDRTTKIWIQFSVSVPVPVSVWN